MANITVSDSEWNIHVISLHLHYLLINLLVFNTGLFWMTEKGDPSLWKMQTEFPHLQRESGTQNERPQDFQETKGFGGPSSRNKGLSNYLNEGLWFIIS